MLSKVCANSIIMRSIMMSELYSVIKELILREIKKGNNVFINTNGKNITEVLQEVKSCILEEGFAISLLPGRAVVFGLTIGGRSDYFLRVTPDVLFGGKKVVIIYGGVGKSILKN